MSFRATVDAIRQATIQRAVMDQIIQPASPKVTRESTPRADYATLRFFGRLKSRRPC